MNISGSDNPFYGKKHTDLTIDKISTSRTGKTAGKNHPLYGKTHNVDAINKMSLVKKGNKYAVGHHNNGHLGISCTEETKKKISFAHIGKTASLETRKKMSESQKKRHNV